MLSGHVVEVCARRGTAEVLLEQGVRANARSVSGVVAVGVVVTEVPPGTSGYGDLVRGAEMVRLDGGSLEVAAMLDLLRIADAGSDLEARRQALAFQAALDVGRARAAPRRRSGAVGEEIEAWLARQTPVA